MGNQILSKYAIDKSGFVEGGCYLKWRYATASHYARPQEVVTIFFFEKKKLALFCETDRESLLEILRQDARNLQKLRHPSILPLVEPLYEDTASLCFVTKHVNKTLAGHLDTFSSQNHLTHRGFPLEAKSGLYDICEAVAFLHNDAKLAHLNISPTSIFLSSQFRWFLGSFGYATRLDSLSKQSQETHRIMFQREIFQSDSCIALNPCLSYTAPELTQRVPQYSYASDIYSLGLLLLQIINPIKGSLLNTAGNRDMAGYTNQCSAVSSHVESFSCFPDFSMLVTQMIHPDPKCRPKITEVLSSPFFNDTPIKVLRSLERFVEKTDSQKLEFLSELSNILSQPPEDFVTNVELLRCRIILPLVEFLNQPNLTVPLLSILFSLFPKIIDQEVFDKYIWIKLKSLIQSPRILAQAVLLIVDHLDYLFQFSETDQEKRADLVPFVIKCLSLQVESIQINTARVLLQSIRFIDHVTMMTRILPVLLETAVSIETSHKVKLEFLMFLSHITEEIDGRTINNLVIKNLAKVANINSSALVAVTCSQILSKLIPIIGFEKGAEHILPLLIVFLANQNLNYHQFEIILELLLHSIHTFAKKRRQEFQSFHNVVQHDRPVEPGNVEMQYSTQVNPLNSFDILQEPSSHALIDTPLEKLQAHQSSTLTPFITDYFAESLSCTTDSRQENNSPAPPNDPHGLHILCNAINNKAQASTLENPSPKRNQQFIDVFAEAESYSNSHTQVKDFFADAFT